MRQSVQLAIDHFLDDLAGEQSPSPLEGGGTTLGVKPNRSQERATTPRERLESALEAGIRLQRYLILWPIAASGAVLALACWIVISFASSPAIITAVFGATGLSLSSSYPWWRHVSHSLWEMAEIRALLPVMSNEELERHLRILRRARHRSDRERRQLRGRASGRADD